MEIVTWFDVNPNGSKQINKKDEFKMAFDSLKPGRYIYVIKKVENNRSLEQNNAMWGVPYMYFKPHLIDTGNLPPDCSKNDVHEFCMVNCLPNDYRERIYEIWKNKPGVVNMKTGEVYKSPFRLTSTLMSTTDAMNYYSNMQNFYAENFSSGPDDQVSDPDPKKKKTLKT
jgi:hypothetical protein